MGDLHEIAAMVAQRHGIPLSEAARLARRFISRQGGTNRDWWLRQLDAQFETHIGPYPRVRCGEETHLSHLTPDPGERCGDCGVGLGDYHVFGCDAEECSNCHGQAFCCECEDGFADQESQ